MSQQQETATDRLVSVIQAIQLGRKTGLLTVKRGEGITLEEGSITFVNGQITVAGVGRRSHSEALNWLSTWGHCRFTFVLSESNSSPRTTGTLDIPYPLPSSSIQPPTPRQTSPLGVDTNHKTSEQLHDLDHVPTAPYRTRQLDLALRIMEQLGLSRTHRHLFFLIDGQRSTAELIRLLGRSKHEVEQLLYDLEQATLIHISNTTADK